MRAILDAAGTGPAPRRAGPAWRQLLAVQARAIIARDFRVAGTVLLKRLYVLVFTGRGARRRHLAGVTAHPAGAWAVQQARSLAMDLGDRLGTLRFLMHDRDPLCTTAFGEVFKAEVLQIITTLPRTSRMKAVCERVIGTLRCGLPGRILILGDRHPVLVLRESLVHYDRHRPRQFRQRRLPDIENAVRPGRAGPRSVRGNPSSRE